MLSASKILVVADERVPSSGNQRSVRPIRCVPHAWHQLETQSASQAPCYLWWRRFRSDERMYDIRKKGSQGWWRSASAYRRFERCTAGALTCPSSSLCPLYTETLWGTVSSCALEQWPRNTTHIIMHELGTRLQRAIHDRKDWGQRNMNRLTYDQFESQSWKERKKERMI